MVKVNPHYKRTKKPYIFGLIEEKLNAVQKAHPKTQVLNLGVGDITRPLSQSIVKAVMKGVAEMGERPIGYGSPFGYPFLREAITKNEYHKYGISPVEIFISDGTKSDSSYIQTLFCQSCSVGITDPTYPTYLDTSLMAGRTEIHMLPCNAENGFIPSPPDFPIDIIYLCTPNNPTGVALPRPALQKWVDYAHENKSILLIDAAYESFITSIDTPRSIYEIEGSKQVAIEMRTFSKTSGFTGLRCAYTVIPKETDLIPLWEKRQNATTNGVSYPIQRGAEAALSPLGASETALDISQYKRSASILREGLLELKEEVYGGINAPYLFWKTPEGKTSWEFFDILLNEAQIVTIPGSSFGVEGEGYVRLSSFLCEETAQKALFRIRNL